MATSELALNVLVLFLVLLIRLERPGAGQLLTRAGAAFAVLWIIVIAGRAACFGHDPAAHAALAAT